MDSDFKRMNLQKSAIELLDRADRILASGSDEIMAALLRRISNIGSIAVLNYESLNENDIDVVLKMMSLCESISASNMDNHFAAIESLANSVEVLFREKKMLLDRSDEKVVAA